MKNYKIKTSTLKLYRISRGLSQTDLANQLGFTKNYISNIECGKTVPRPSNLAKICSAIGVDIKEVISEV